MEKNIENIAEKALNGRNIRLIDVEIRGERKNKVVEIFVDSPGDLSLDELTEVSREINEIIDGSEVKDEILKVVVSSPGVERPFRYDWQAAKHVNRIFDFGNGDEKQTGKLIKADGDNLVFEIKTGKKETRETAFKFSELELLKVKLPF
ncbi:MAG: hypothetical protein LWX07_01115 [Bacteroidetes bacterium]|nr:hypothetical protein [Bacteroidota bacterium]